MRPLSSPLPCAQAAKDGDGDEDEEPQQPLFDLSKLQASVDGKQADFETRKRARLVTEDFQSDKGERSSGGGVGPYVAGDSLSDKGSMRAGRAAVKQRHWEAGWAPVCQT